MMSARTITLTRRGLLCGLLASGSAFGLGRTPYGGRVVIDVPWSVQRLDPHDVADPLAAIFGDAVADPLYSLDAQGRPYPALAQGLPKRTPAGTLLSLRPFLSTGRGKPLDARDVLYSLGRARERGAAGLLAPFSPPKLHPADGLALLFDHADPDSLARALASPVTAVLPRGFSASNPDATGAFLARRSRSTLLLERNVRAARGAAFLLSVELRPARDLAAALRAFEAGETDVGWLGAGLHRPRPGALGFDAGRYGWAVLRTGSAAGSWGAAGVAQRLLDGIEPARLSHLGLSDLSSAPHSSAAWGGAPCQLAVSEAAPQLIEIARALAAILSRPGHEVTAAPRPLAYIERAKLNGDYTLLLDFVRTIGEGPELAMLALLAAADPALARTPPTVAPPSVRGVARTATFGVVGELRARGAHIPELVAFSPFALGSTYRRAQPNDCSR